MTNIESGNKLLKEAGIYQPLPFYFEKEYTKEEAGEAVKGTTWIFKKAKTLKRLLEKGAK